MAEWHHSISFGGLTAYFSWSEGLENMRQERGAPLYEKNKPTGNCFSALRARIHLAII